MCVSLFEPYIYRLLKIRGLLKVITTLFPPPAEEVAPVSENGCLLAYSIMTTSLQVG
jgi:hypothetical protein